jgi:hypothetical protein
MSSKVFAAIGFALFVTSLGASTDARPNRPMTVVHPLITHPHVAMMGTLSDGRVATVYTDGRAVIAPPRLPSGSPRAKAQAYLASRRVRRTTQVGLSALRYGSLTGTITPPQRRKILYDLEHPPQPYVPGRVIVVFKSGVTVPQDVDALSPAAAMTLRASLGAKRKDLSPHAFTTDARTNLTLMHLGVDRADRLFSKVDRGTLSSMRARAESRTGHQLLAFDNAFALHVGASSVQNAVRTLRASPSVAYVSPDFAMDSMIAQRAPIPSAAKKELSTLRRSLHPFGRSVKSTSVAMPSIPSNVAVSFSAQALLNAPGVDAIAAFDEIGQRFSQLPGAGEIITNVGLGDVDDASAGLNPNDPCNAFVAGGVPTTHVIGGQRYLDWPSLPLIPVWVADESGNLSTTADVCGVDPSLAEVGLDFSVMAPLPDNLQRSGETDTTGFDLVGIAPGASYRWVAPGMVNGAVGESDVLGAFIGAARQLPAPNVITASIGFGFDADGFPGRYLEDDPLSESVVASIVSSNIVVCIAANDGTRDLTAAAIGPSGGSAATNVGTATTTSLDLGLSTAPSVDLDSGAIDVGASTLDDIIAANPLNPAFANRANTKSFVETRYDGDVGFSSGFGSRVNVSAPGDNILALNLTGPSFDSVGVGIVGGTSASAPATAAAAAIALQVGRLTGHQLTMPSQVRALLASTGTPVVTPPDSDVSLNVGPQVDVRRMVEQQLATAGSPVQPGIARLAIQGRRSGSFAAEVNFRVFNDATYLTTLDPTMIKLDGPYALGNLDLPPTFPGSDTGADLNSYITIAPDWEGIPANASYRLSVAGQPSRVIATTPYVRLLPAQLFASAGVSLTPGVSRTLSLTYSATVGLHIIAESTFQLTFGPPATDSRLVFAPVIPAVVSGQSIPVSYDFSNYPRQLLGSPTLNVSTPGNGAHHFDQVVLYPYFSLPLSGTKGTVNVPVSALAGAGTYAMWIDLQPGATAFASDISDLAFTRVDAGTARPPAPLLSLGNGTPAVHTLDVPYQTQFTVSYDVSTVPGASGAIVELAAPPPSPAFVESSLDDVFNTIRNPNGNTLDDNGVVSGSLYHVAASGVTGTVTIDPVAAGIPATATVNVRVLPTSGAGPIAEASDADTLKYHGIESALGGPVVTAFIDPNGTDGLLEENGDVGPSQANQQLIPTELFDIGTGANSGVILSFTDPDTADFPIVQNDVEVAEDLRGFPTNNFYAAAPLSSGIFHSFTFPPGIVPATAIVSSVATNSTSSRSAYLTSDFVTGAFLVTRGDITTGTGFAPGIDITALMNGAFPFDANAQTFAYDPTADRAYVLVENDNVACDAQSPALVTVDFGTRSATTTPLPIDGGDPNFGFQMAIDPGTGRGAIATNCHLIQAGQDVFRSELSLVDLATSGTRPVFAHVLNVVQEDHHGIGEIDGGDSPIIGIDPVNHLILQRSIWCPTLVGLYDQNARVCLNLYDESGRLTKTIPNLFSGAFLDTDYFNGVNGTLRRGATFGQETVTPFIFSFDVQPFRY